MLLMVGPFTILFSAWQAYGAAYRQGLQGNHFQSLRVRSPSLKKMLNTTLLKPRVCDSLQSSYAGSGVVFTSDGGKVITQNLNDALQLVADERRLVFLSTADSTFADFADNVVCSAQKFGNFSNGLVIALDPLLHETLTRHSVSSFYSESLTSLSVAKHGQEKSTGKYLSASYHDVVHMKTLHVAAALSAGFDVFFTDSDVVFRRDVHSEMHSILAENTDVDFLMQYNTPSGINYLNPGIALWRRTPGTMSFIQRALDLECKIEQGLVQLNNKGTSQGDQPVYNHLLACDGPRVDARNTDLSHPLDEKRDTRHRFYQSSCGEDAGGNVLNFKYGVFSKLYFQSGHVGYSGFRKHAKMFHANWMTTGKMEKLKRAGLWCLDTGDVNSDEHHNVEAFDDN